MKSTLVAIDPSALVGRRFEHFCDVIRLFQERELFSQVSIASVIHSSQYLMPYPYFQKHKDEFATEARKAVAEACEGKFAFSKVRILSSESSANEEIVNRLAKHGRRVGADLMCLASNDRKGVPYWFLGSVSETAALSAALPVFVVKTSVAECAFARHPIFVLAVDVAAPPSVRDIHWIAGWAKGSGARIHLVYVIPGKKLVLEKLQQRRERLEAKQTLRSLKRAFAAKGVDATLDIHIEKHSVAHTITALAEQKQAWVTITTTAKRSRVRKLLLGSTARHILALSKRPFLSLRLPPRHSSY